MNKKRIEALIIEKHLDRGVSYEPDINDIESTHEIVKEIVAEKLQVALHLIQRLKLSMLAHPDCEKGSEFDDYTGTSQEFLDEHGYQNEMVDNSEQLKE